jgi:hypothetical protein
MVVLLKYCQGSFAREERRDCENAAVMRAGELMYANSGCENFQIIDERGRVLKSHEQIRAAYESFWQDVSSPCAGDSGRNRLGEPSG